MFLGAVIADRFVDVCFNESLMAVQRLFLSNRHQNWKTNKGRPCGHTAITHNKLKGNAYTQGVVIEAFPKSKN